MACPECGADNRATARFCDRCGTSLPRRCPTCGADLRAGARFCDQCGGRLEETPARPAAERERSAAGYTPRHLAEKILTSRSALVGERKQVTVLFADVAGFTSISSRVDPEDLHAIMDECFQHVLEAVHRYEGTVNQFTGDGVMALFGAPIAHEDHAVRAAAAALAIQQALRPFSERLRRERGIDFAMRIGLNTGEVVVGRIGDDLRMDYTAQGETVNLAARLQSAASPGTVLASESTHRLLARHFITRPAEVLTLKGIPEPVRSYEVSAHRRRAARFSASLERGLTPLVGRRREIEFLLDRAGRLEAGRGRVVSVVGEAGVGKSRLIHELRRALGDAGVSCRTAQCLPHGESRPFHLVLQMLEEELGVCDGDRGAKIEAAIRSLDPAIEWVIPQLKHLLGLPTPEGELGGLDPAQQKRRLVEAVRTFVVRSARVRPIVILVEDLQWIDPHSEEVLAAVADAVAEHPVLLIGAHRNEYSPPWQTRTIHDRLALDPLSKEETAEMAASLLGPDAAPYTRDLVVRRGEGNPLFVEELAAWVREGSGGAAPAEGDEEVPATIRDLLAARIDRLPEGPKQTLQVASVLGREFPLALLEAVAPPGRDVRADLDELVRLELLHQTDAFPVERYRFALRLAQEVAYQGLLQKSRAELHGRAGEALERLVAERPAEALPELVRHFTRSPLAERAVRYLVAAGDRAASLFAFAEARASYRQALERLSAAANGSGLRPELLRKLGDTAFAEGLLGEALEDWASSLGIVEAAGDRLLAADLRRRMAAAAWAAGEKEVALAHVELGLASLGEDLENLEAAKLYDELGRIQLRLGDTQRAMASATRALEIGERLGSPDVVACAYNTIGGALARGGDLERGIDYVRRGLDAALTHGLGSVACRAYANLAVMHTTIDHRRSAEYCREGLALAQRIGDQLHQSWLHCTLAGGHCTLSGDYDEGVRAAETAAEIDRRLGQRNHLPIPLILLGQIYQCRGEPDRSERYYREALAVAETVGEPQLLCPCYEGLATLALETGDEASAAEWLRRSRELQESAGWSADTFLVLPFLC